jgi:hypothetical protein
MCITDFDRRGVEFCDEASFFRDAKGIRAVGAASKTWQPKHRDGGGGQKPQNLRLLAQGFKRDGSPGEDESGVIGRDSLFG